MPKLEPKRKNKPPGLKKDTKDGKGQDVNKKVKTIAAGQDQKPDIYHAIAFWGLAALLFLAPYFRGLFYADDQKWAFIFAVVFFWFAWLWKWRRRDNSFVSHPFDYFVLALPVVYIISLFQAVNYSLAIDEVVKTTLYFVVFWASSRLARNEDDVAAVLWVIYISAVGVALAGLATTTGFIDIPGGYIRGRIFSTFQYPNVLASFLGASVLIGIYFWRKAGLSENDAADDGKKPHQNAPLLILSRFSSYLYAVGNFLLIAVLLGSKSQGGFLVFAVVFILFIIGMARDDRVPVLAHCAFAGVPAVVFIWLFVPPMEGSISTGKGVLLLSAGLVLVLAGQALFSLIERKGFFQWITAHRKIIITGVLVIAVSACIGLGIFISGQGDTVKNLVDEIRLRNATERVYFFQDSLKMFIERPIIGWGGGGWQEAYRSYQGYFYNSIVVHGHYFQVMVEAGIIGLLVLLGIWAYFLYACHRLYHGSKNGTRFLVLTITMAAVLIGLHAAIDFDLSYSALALVLWTMFGLARGLGRFSSPGAEGKKIKADMPLKYSVIAAVTVFSVLAGLFTGSLAAAGTYARQSSSYLKDHKIEQGIKSIQKAIAYNPLQADYHGDLARIYAGLGSYDRAIAEALTAVRLSKYDVVNYAYLTNLLIAGNIDIGEVVFYAEKTLSLAPYNIECYELLSKAYFKAGFSELIGGNQAAAKQYFEQAVLVPDRITDRIDSLDVQEKRLWQDADPMETTLEVKLNVGMAQYILGRWPEAEDNLNAALNGLRGQNKGEAALWLSVMKSKQGQDWEANNLLEQANQLAPQLARDYDRIRDLQVFSD